MRVLRADRDDNRHWVVRLEEMTAKVLRACPQGFMQGKMYAIEYTTMARPRKG